MKFLHPCETFYFQRHLSDEGIDSGAHDVSGAGTQAGTCAVRAKSKQDRRRPRESVKRSGQCRAVRAGHHLGSLCSGISKKPNWRCQWRQMQMDMNRTGTLSTRFWRHWRIGNQRQLEHFLPFSQLMTRIGAV